jgi:hypothetical protein
MIKGTTAQFKFKLPCTKEDLLWATITVGQTGNNGTVDAPLPIIKKLIHCSAPNTSNELCVSLDALETTRFSEKIKAYVQFRAQRKDGTVFGNRTKYVSVYPMSDVILDQDVPIIPSVENEGLITLDAGRIID